MPLRAPKGFIDESDPKVCQIGHPAPPWLVNYADLMTELVCFFVILYALSAALDKKMQETMQDMKEVMEEKKLPGDVKMGKEGLQITFEEKGGVSYFESGFADITPTMKELLDAVGPKLREAAMGNRRIVVEGHTDDVPIHNDYFWSNWELSTSRATSVVEHLVGEKGLPASCMAAMGYGEFQPICREATPECRARNRRVVFLIKNADPGNQVGCTGKALAPDEAAEGAGEAAAEGAGPEARVDEGGEPAGQTRSPRPRSLQAAPAEGE